MGLQNEIKQRKTFSSPEQEAFLSILRTADLASREVADALGGVDLTPTQYNVMRILRGAGQDGIACGGIADRMVTRDPDITRLLDRLIRRGLAERARSSADRRVVIARITPAGKALVDSLDEPIAAAVGACFAGMSATEVGEIIRLLEAVRRACGAARNEHASRGTR
ncbi:MAG: MarR family transcriptional regulator [Candidatus Schekmanbacteria bacterium]|nr:MarR family transcriptional regulator [Candidatus Schekmanbacteria bacterium]